MEAPSDFEEAVEATGAYTPDSIFIGTIEENLIIFINFSSRLWIVQLATSLGCTSGRMGMFFQCYGNVVHYTVS